MSAAGVKTKASKGGGAPPLASAPDGPRRISPNGGHPRNAPGDELQNRSHLGKKGSPHPMVSLDSLFEIARGGSPRPIQDFLTEDLDGVNWISISDAPEGAKYITNTKRKIIKDGVKRSRMVYPGDFLLTNSMSFGRPYIMKTTGCIHDGWLVLSPRDNRVHPDFFFHLLSSDSVYAEFERLAAGATVKNLNIDLVKGIRIPLPPLPEQRRIAEVLDRVEGLRTKRRQALSHLDSLSLAIFEELFGIDNCKSARYPVKFVSDYVSWFQGGKSFEADEGGSHSSRNRILKISAVTGMKFRPEESKPVKEEYDPPSEHFVRPGDLLFSRANTSELVGAVAFVERTPPNLLLPDKLWRFVWKDPNQVEPLFIWSLFQSKAVRQEIERRATGTSGSMKNISQEKVMGIQTIFPPFAVQQFFARRIATLEKLKATHGASLAQLDALFASLQHRAFRGEL